MIKDILDALQTWPKWKRLETAPDRIDAMEKRLGELEQRLARCPGEGCPKCGEMAFRVERSAPDAGPFGGMGAIVRHMRCEKCGYTESHQVAPK